MTTRNPLVTDDQAEGYGTADAGTSDDLATKIFTTGSKEGK